MLKLNSANQGISSMKQKAIPIIIPSLLLGLVFNWFFVGHMPGVSILLYTSLILGITFYLTWGFKHTLNKSVYLLTPIILFFASMVFVRANQFLAFINVLVIIYLLAVVARLTHQPTLRIRQFEVSQYVALPKNLSVRFIGEFFAFFRKLMDSRKTTAKTAPFVPIVRGVIISLPILVVFLLLLSSADLIFGKYVSSFFDFNISPELISRSVLIGFVASIFIGAFAYIFLPSSAETSLTHSPRKRLLGTTEAFIILGSVTVLFLTFVIIQLTYLFGGSDLVARTGYTYAEYARKGFFELIAVATISLLLVGVIKKITTFRSLPETTAFKWLSGLLAVLVLVIMYSAHTRLDLYEGAYGFTTLRLLSHLFILWLAYAFAQLLYFILREKSDNTFAFQLFVSGLCFVALINLINPDSFIAQQNIRRFDRTGKIDLYYLSNLSEDAVPAITQLLDHPNQELQKRAANILYRQEQRINNQSSSWQSANLSRQQAKNIFNSHAVQIEAGKSYSGYQEFEKE